LLESRTGLSAWQLLLKAPTFSLVFTITLWGRLVLGTSALLTGLALPFFGLADRDRLIRRLLGGLVAFLLVLALFQIPGADTLGLRQEFKLDYINLCN